MNQEKNIKADINSNDIELTRLNAVKLIENNDIKNKENYYQLADLRTYFIRKKIEKK